MRSIGVRELRQRASEYLRLVEHGETVEVTDHGRPVALLVPIPEEPLARLSREGRVRAPKDPWNVDSIVSSALRPGASPLSQVLQEMRDDERG